MAPSPSGPPPSGGLREFGAIGFHQGLAVVRAVGTVTRVEPEVEARRGRVASARLAQARR